MLTAGFNDSPGKALRNLHGLRNAAALRHQARNVRTRTQIAATFQAFHPDADGHFLNLCQVFLPASWEITPN